MTTYTSHRSLHQSFDAKRRIVWDEQNIDENINWMGRLRTLRRLDVGGIPLEPDDRFETQETR